MIKKIISAVVFASAMVSLPVYAEGDLSELACAWVSSSSPLGHSSYLSLSCGPGWACVSFTQPGYRPPGNSDPLDQVAFPVTGLGCGYPHLCGAYNGRHVRDLVRIGLCHKTEDSMQCAPDGTCLPVHEVS